MAQKDVIYIDVDDEITGIIEKVQNSSGKVVALVLPKRATVFQSIVNVKLLKRTADSAKKSLVLITSEQGLMPLAGAVGVYVAKTLQSKPAIPPTPNAPSDAPVAADDAIIEDAEDVPLDQNAPVGELAGDTEETIEVDNDDLDNSKKAAGASAKTPRNKKLKVPNFERFRNRLFIGIGVGLLLIIGLILAAFVLPKATITIKTDTTDIKLSASVSSSPTYTSLNTDTDPSQVPGKLQELKKSDTQKTPATGKKDMGTKASGTVTFSTLTNCITPVSGVPSGTSVSSGTFTFITQKAATFSPSGLQDGKCVFSSSAIDVIAQNAGDSYNLSARNYSVSGRAEVTAKGSAMSGGTSKIITVVSQQDIDGLKQKMTESLSASASQELTAQLKDAGYFPLTETLTSKEPTVTSTPAVDSESTEVTVTVNATFTMAGAKQDDLEKALEAKISKEIDTSKQKILDNGMDTATVRIEEKQADGTTRFSLDTTAKVGVEQNETAIKQAITGKKKSEIKSIIQAQPGVKDVTVEFSPFWVTKAPKPEKITLIFEQQQQ